MARKSKTQQLTEGIAGQHLALSVAAHLARTQLVPDPLKVYDGQHLTDMLDVVGLALARTAPLHVIDPAAGEPRQLTPRNRRGVAKRGAHLLLKDGRTLAGVSIKRSDLRQAIAILKAVGCRDRAAARAEGGRAWRPTSRRCARVSPRWRACSRRRFFPRKSSGRKPGRCGSRAMRRTGASPTSRCS